MRRMTVWILILSVLAGMTGCSKTDKKNAGWKQDDETAAKTGVEVSQSAENTEAITEEPETIPVVLPEVDDPIVWLSAVYAGMTVTAGQDVAGCPDYFWKTIVNGASIVILQTADADSEGNLYLERDVMEDYIHTMFPGVGEWPEITEWDGVTVPGDEDDPYIVRANFWYDESSLEILSVEPSGEEDAEIMVLVRGQIDESVRVRISHVNDTESSFGWVIRDAEISQG